MLPFFIYLSIGAMDIVMQPVLMLNLIVVSEPFSSSYVFTGDIFYHHLLKLRPYGKELK